jgi:hypothetical protein
VNLVENKIFFAISVNTEMLHTGKDYFPELIGKHQNPELWVRGGAIVDKKLLVNQLYVDTKSSMLTLTGQQLASDNAVYGTGEVGATPMYYTSGDNLYRYDHSTHQTTLIGNCGGKIMFDIAINPDGVLFGITSNGTLYTISTDDATITQIGVIQTSQMNSLTFDANGVLYALDENTLVTINIFDASKTVVGDVGGAGAYSMGDLVFFNGVLYLAATDYTLIKYPNLNDLSERVIVGTLPFQVYGLAQVKVNDRAVLLGTTADFKVCEINPDTAACTNVSQFASNSGHEYFIGGATAQCWARPEWKSSQLNPPIRVPDNTVCSVVLHLVGRDMVTNDVHTSSWTLRVKNLDEFHILTSMPISRLGEGTLGVNDVTMQFLADQTSFVILLLTKSPNTVKWTGTVVKTTD